MPRSILKLKRKSSTFCKTLLSTVRLIDFISSARMVDFFTASSEDYVYCSFLMISFSWTVFVFPCWLPEELLLKQLLWEEKNQYYFQWGRLQNFQADLTTFNELANWKNNLLSIQFSSDTIVSFQGGKFISLHRNHASHHIQPHWFGNGAQAGLIFFAIELNPFIKTQPERKKMNKLENLKAFPNSALGKRRWK